MAAYIMALDLGTTGNRSLLFNAQGEIVSQAYKELTQFYPQPGWVEHDPREIWQDTLTVIRSAIEQAEIAPSQIAAIGIAVQRETCLLWDRETGRPLRNAIVWQDRRTADLCEQLAPHAAEIYDRTGLTLDAYFSATKLKWLLDQVQRDQPAIDRAQLLAGTIDTWILWHLTGGKIHATDDSNASRTLLYNLSDRQWDDRLLELFGIPASLLPQVQPSLSLFGHTALDLLGAEIPIAAMLGDQQASLLAHGCDRPGLSKCTYGTGCFLVSHTGSEIKRSQHRLLSTIGWTSATQPAGYALEGSLFTTGACIQWLRDGLQIITAAAETEALAQQIPDNGGVYFVPALSGLGAPHWDMSARGAFLGMTGGCQRSHLVRAVLESIAYQVKEVVQAIDQDTGTPIATLRVDGGACQNDWLMQFQADVLGIPVERPAVLDATAQGAAFAAGLTIEFWPSYADLVATRQLDRTFYPSDQASRRQADFLTWQSAVDRTKRWPH